MFDQPNQDNSQNDDQSSTTTDDQYQSSVNDLGTPPVLDNSATPDPGTVISSDDSVTPIQPETDATASDDIAVDLNTPAEDSSAAGSTNELIDLKSKALQQLTPLVDKLDQTPEEKFRTVMMMIQASDNQALIKDAYQTAQDITDEKSKAQALLDVVNEINYFTQNKD